MPKRSDDLDSALRHPSRRTFIRQALCATVGTAALTNTIRDLRFINAAMAQSSGISDYKALVCIFLNGGNDSNNLFIPTIPAEYANYAAIRTAALALPNADGSGAAALALNSLTSDGHTYGIHPACPELAALFNAGKMAPVFNVGTLVYPVTKAQYQAKSVPLPPQLFSHADQQVQWQTSVPDQPPVSGWGGRCADLLDAYNPRNNNAAVMSMCVTLAGANTFEVGGTVQQYSVSSGGVVSLTTNLGPSTAQAGRTAALNNILGIDDAQQNLLLSNYSQALEHALASGTGLTTALNASPMSAYWNLASTFPTTITVPNGGGTLTGSSLIVAAQDGRQDHRVGLPREHNLVRPRHEAADLLRAGWWLRSPHRPDEATPARPRRTTPRSSSARRPTSLPS